MFASILVLCGVLLLTLMIDYKKLKQERYKRQKVIYWIIFGIGFVGIAVYAFDPLAPDFFSIFQTQENPIKEWVQ